MKTIRLLILLFFASLQVQAQNPSLQINFTTLDQGGFSHEKHVLAVWVETKSLEFVKTPLVYADVRKSDLFTWNAAPADGNEVDAITGATQLTHKAYSVLWNCLNLQGTHIPDGDYVLHLEQNNKHLQGPLVEIDFVMDGNAFTLNSADQNYFKDISLVYTPDTSGTNTGVSEIIENNKNETLKVYPNPASTFVNVSFNLSEKEQVTVKIFDSSFRLVKELANRKYFAIGENTIRWDFNKELVSGTYFVYFSTKSHVWYGKHIVVN